MTPIPTLSSKVHKLERRRRVHVRYKLIEENYLGDEFWPACKFALTRNGKAVFRFPEKLSAAEWQAKYSQPNPGINP